MNCHNKSVSKLTKAMNSVVWMTFILMHTNLQYCIENFKLLMEHTFKMLHTSHGQCHKEANEAIKLLHSE